MPLFDRTGPPQGTGPMSGRQMGFRAPMIPPPIPGVSAGSVVHPGPYPEEIKDLPAYFKAMLAPPLKPGWFNDLGPKTKEYFYRLSIPAQRYTINMLAPANATLRDWEGYASGMERHFSEMSDEQTTQMVQRTERYIADGRERGETWLMAIEPGDVVWLSQLEQEQMEKVRNMPPPLRFGLFAVPPPLRFVPGAST